MDAVLLEGLVREWRARLVGSRVVRATSPTEHRVEITFFGGRAETVLAFILVPQAALAYIPEHPLRQGDHPSPFAMLLRRRLNGFRVLDLPDPNLDRTLTVRLAGLTEVGDEEERTLVFEGYGPRPNLVLVDAAGRITDAFRRVAPDPEGRRGRLPGLEYDASGAARDAMRRGPNRIDPRTLSLEALWELLRSTFPHDRAGETLSRRLLGVSPAWAREILVQLGTAQDARGADLPEQPPADRAPSWDGLRATFAGEATDPGVARASEGHVIGAFPFPPRQYGAVVFERTRSLTEAVRLASERTEAEHTLEAKRVALVREVRRRRERLISRLAKQEEEWHEAERHLGGRHVAELILGNLYRIPPGATEVWLDDWEAAVTPDAATVGDPAKALNVGPAPGEGEAGAPRIRVVLDPTLTPVDYAQRLFLRYQKAKRRKTALLREMERGRHELFYMDALEDQALRAFELDVLDALASEAERAGTLLHPARPKQARKGARSQHREELAFRPLRYRTPGGLTLLVGRTAAENDRLTLHEARSDDLWFHVAEGAGAHVILELAGARAPSEADLAAAAELAAYHSPQARSSHVEVVMCSAGHVRRMPGGRPGLVLYDRERSYSVTPDANKIAAMRVGAADAGEDPAGSERV